MAGGSVFLLIGLTLTAAAPDPVLERYEYQQIQMGVPFKLALYAADEPSANRAAEAAFRRVRALNATLSDYDPDSETRRLCATSSPGRPVGASEDLFTMLARSLAFSRESSGAFDVTVGPVVKLWRKARRQKKLPDAEALAAARGLVGYRHVRLSAEARTVELLKPGMQLDFGGIAQGYAADEMLRVLREQGISRALVDASGDVVAGDPPPGKAEWTIGVAPLESPDGTPSRYVGLENAAVTTSGSAYQFVEVDGRRYSHIVDPQTGLGLERIASVTVIAADGTTADALATALCVMTPEAGLALVEAREGAAALIVEKREDGVRTVASKGWDQHEVPPVAAGR
jgi:thiamine biosynthesis lipoprotein